VPVGRAALTGKNPLMLMVPDCMNAVVVNVDVKGDVKVFMPPERVCVAVSAPSVTTTTVTVKGDDWSVSVVTVAVGPYSGGVPIIPDDPIVTVRVPVGTGFSHIF